MDFSVFKENKESAEFGFGVHYFLDSFNQTFYKSCRSDFEAFFVKHKEVKKWMVFSDYALYDKRKKQDVITFSIVPYVLGFDDFSNLLQALAPKDLKSSRNVKDRFIEFLKDGPVFNISIALDRKRRLHSDEKYYHQTKIEMMIKQLQKWCITTPEAKDHYIEFIDKLNVLKSEVISPGANLKVIRDIEILSSLAAYLMFEISKLIDVERIGWFSDRDRMLDYKAAKFESPFIFDVVHHLYYLFCNSADIPSKGKLVLGVPESGSNGKVWYDAFNRIPDLIAGTFADYDYKKNKCSHDKFIAVIENLFTSNQNNLFFTTKFSKGEYSVSRLQFSSQLSNANKKLNKDKNSRLLK
ncbi:hypothetical protein AB4406_11095 [Vibrio splendidus]